MWIETGGRQVSREDLFEMVWTKPIISIAADFGISDVALANKCRKLGIPRPERGFWARVQRGWKGDKPKLPV